MVRKSTFEKWIFTNSFNRKTTQIFHFSTWKLRYKQPPKALYNVYRNIQLSYTSNYLQSIKKYNQTIINRRKLFFCYICFIMNRKKKH